MPSAGLPRLDLSSNHICGAKVSTRIGDKLECWRSASWLTSISAAIISELRGKRVLQECWDSAQCWLTSISAGNHIGETVAEIFAGVLCMLAQCPALAHLDLVYNDIQVQAGQTLLLCVSSAGSPGNR